MSLRYGMRTEFTNVLRATTAIQVATIELADEDMNDNIALPALEKCVAQLISAVKDLKKAVR